MRAGQLDLLVGGPPCQPFSKAGYWSNGDSLRLGDLRANTIAQFLRVVEDFLPSVILFENVKGFTYKNKDEGYRYFIDTIAKINREHNVKYKPSTFVLNCADYGVPQIRERLFILASIDGKTFTVPDPMYGKDCSEGYFTSWDAIGDLDSSRYSQSLKVEGKWAGLLSSIPEGQNYLWHTRKGGGLQVFGYRRRYWNFLLKLSRSLPSWTISATPGPSAGPFHWRNRKLSVLELARLQTFPDDWNFSGSYQSSRRQIGNAVPPLIGEMLGREIINQYFGQKNRNELTLLLNRNNKRFRKIKVNQVPDEFMGMIGEHEDHPGVGKGPGSIS